VSHLVFAAGGEAVSSRSHFVRPKSRITTRLLLPHDVVTQPPAQHGDYDARCNTHNLLILDPDSFRNRSANSDILRLPCLLVYPDSLDADTTDRARGMVYLPLHRNRHDDGSC
jgi:hypothetical protein